MQTLHFVLLLHFRSFPSVCAAKQFLEVTKGDYRFLPLTRSSISLHRSWPQLPVTQYRPHQWIPVVWERVWLLNLTYPDTVNALDLQNISWCVGRCQLSAGLRESYEPSGNRATDCRNETCICCVRGFLWQLQHKIKIEQQQVSSNYIWQNDLFSIWIRVEIWRKSS